ncbi:hypothetical protein FSP39_011902 [Pinctada imbricata]|uniref:Uncharacterized protein n=1 Tax=Pinctada imbricata TaxID=66713 RepID=A0AA88YTH0_PINIB|nr:hypothetical protein FSP39_011902 [Pinctada imbricata]
MPETFKTCIKCPNQMNTLDDHAECYRHRVCNAAFPCDACKDWSEDKRATVQKMIEKRKVTIARKSATSTGQSTEASLGNASPPAQVPSVGNTPIMENIAPSVGMQNPSFQGNMHFPAPHMASFPPYIMDVQWQKHQEEIMNKFLENKLSELVSKQIRDSNNNQNPPNSSEPKRRFDRFRPSADQVSRVSSDDDEDGDDRNTVRSKSPPSRDILDLTDNQSVQSSRHTNDSVEDISQDSHNSAGLQNFMKKVATELNIEVEKSDKEKSDYKSYVSNRLVAENSRTSRTALPLDGYILDTLTDVDDEFQRKGFVRTYKSTDDDKFRVSSTHFEKFCTTPKLDENIEEGVAGVGRKGRKSSYRFRNSQLHTRNNELWKIDQGSRLLLRELSYGSMIASYLDVVVSDEDKTEALQALMQVFKSMADVTSRILVGSVSARRAIHIDDFAFKNKATENKLLMQSTLGPKLFCGNYFDILHSSAENLRDAKETQHLRANVSTKDNSSDSRKRKREESGTGRQSQNTQPKKGKYDKGRESDWQRPKFSKNKRSRPVEHSSQKNVGKDRLGFRPPK